jgi:beta-phosphoglucomutase
VEKIANELHIDFTLEHNELLKGVSRVRSLDIILEIGKVEASQRRQKQMADSEK